MTRLARTSRYPGRRGISLAEATMSLFILGVALAAIAQLTLASRGMLQVTDRRLIAAQEAAAVLENVRQWPWSDVTTTRVGELKLSAVAERQLPDAKLAIDVEEVAEPLLTRRIQVEVSWATPDDAVRQSVRLTGWRFAP